MRETLYIRLHTIAREIWQWCKNRQIWIYALYNASNDNVEADQQYRITNIDTKWELIEEVHRMLTNQFQKPKIDAFPFTQIN